MYSKLKNVQVIISLLKQNNIKHLVLSPGTRDVPLVHSVEQDSFFKCYSMVDERSAAYFALGLSEYLGEPVCLSCTSSTATCNYLPAVQEAFDRGIQLVLLTADRNNYLLKQGEDQLIEQDGMYGEFVKCAVNLPIVNNDKDLDYCVRKTNEALLELNHFGKGPVQINFQVQVIDLCREKYLPNYRRVERILLNEQTNIDEKIKHLKEKNRVMIVWGQAYYFDERKKKIEALLEEFSKKYDCVVVREETSNIRTSKCLKTCIAVEAMTDTEFQSYAPDIVITIGNHFFSFLKYNLRNIGSRIEHWRVCDDGSYLDNFSALTTIYQCSPEQFLEKITQGVENSSKSQYFDLWKRRVDSVVYPDLKFTNFSVIRDFARVIPENSLVHLTILNSLRMFNLTCNKNVRAFCNLGCDGIDGGVSTFLGQAITEEKPAFIVSGDLSYFYDIYSSTLAHKKNIRMLIINNFAGGEFHNNFGLEKIETLNDYIAAGHTSKVQQFISSTDFKYLNASNQAELDKQLEIFIKESDKPIILEVFTDAHQDAQTLKKFYSLNKKLTFKEKMKKNGKELAKKILKKLKVI